METCAQSSSWTKYCTLRFKVETPPASLGLFQILFPCMKFIICSLYYLCNLNSCTYANFVFTINENTKTGFQSVFSITPDPCMLIAREETNAQAARPWPRRPEASQAASLCPAPLCAAIVLLMSTCCWSVPATCW